MVSWTMSGGRSTHVRLRDERIPGARGGPTGIIGIFSVLSYVVAQRRHEIGVRLALGASYRQVMRMIVRQGVQTIIPGMLAGAVVAFALRRLMAGLLYGVEPTDLPTFSLVTALLATTALLACYVAARRVLQIDSRSALHHD